MRYPAKFERCPDGMLSIKFRDFPAFSYTGRVSSELEATEFARAGLIAAVKAKLDQHKRIPPSSSPDEHEFLVELPLEMSARIILLTEILAAYHGHQENWLASSQATEAEIRNLSDFDTPVGIGEISNRLKDLGKHLELRTTPYYT